MVYLQYPSSKLKTACLGTGLTEGDVLAVDLIPLNGIIKFSLET